MATSTHDKLVRPLPDMVRPEQAEARQLLAEFVTVRVEAWERDRNQRFKEKWQEYLRIWKGEWAPQDQQRLSERSRIITPGTSQAVDTITAELEEATFARELWFDISDDIMDEDQSGMSALRALLAEDLDYADVRAAVTEMYLNAALFGTGIMRWSPDFITEQKVNRQVDPLTGVPDPNVQVDTQLVPKIFFEAVRPDQFVIDSSVTKPGIDGIRAAFGVAIVQSVPRHTVEMRQNDGDAENAPTYYEVDLPGSNASDPLNVNVTRGERWKSDTVDLIEYYGRVPRKLFEAAQKGGGFDVTTIDHEDLVEAKVVIARDNALLQCVNLFDILPNGVRPIYAFPFDIVPSEFWGRGVVEKGYNAQKAQDALVRAKMDSLAYTIAPMIAIDMTRIMPGMDLDVYAGKVWQTNGPVGDALMPVQLAPVAPQVFQAEADFERMITTGTGAQDTAAPLRTNRRNETASGLSMIIGAMLKRLKRVLRLAERNVLNPMLQDVAGAYMIYDPDRYPMADLKMSVRTALGMAARELEQQQAIQLLQYVPPMTPAFWALVSSVVEMSSPLNKEGIQQALQQTIQMVMGQMQQQQQMAQAEGEMRAAETAAKVGATQAKLMEASRENFTQSP